MNATVTYATAREHGAAPAAVKTKRIELLWIASRLDPDARQGVGMEVLWRIALERQKLHGAVTAARRVVDIGRPWLRFLGRWREQTAVFQYQDLFDRYIAWMRDERGFARSTVEQWGRDRVDVDAGAQQVNGCGVSYRMEAYALGGERRRRFARQIDPGIIDGTRGRARHVCWIRPISTPRSIWK